VVAYLAANTKLLGIVKRKGAHPSPLKLIPILTDAIRLIFRMLLKPEGGLPLIFLRCSPCSPYLFLDFGRYCWQTEKEE
jgi:hypothetical protein